MKKHLLWIALPFLLAACGGGKGGSPGSGAPTLHGASNPADCPPIEGTYVEVGDGPRGSIAKIQRNRSGFLNVQVRERQIFLIADGQERGGNRGTGVSACIRGPDGQPAVAGQSNGRHGERRDILVRGTPRDLSVEIRSSTGATEVLQFRRAGR